MTYDLFYTHRFIATRLDICTVRPKLSYNKYWISNKIELANFMIHLPQLSNCNIRSEQALVSDNCTEITPDFSKLKNIYQPAQKCDLWPAACL